MANIPLTLTCADYARVMPLATGEVKPAGIDLTLVLGARGSWVDRAEMLRRAAQDEAAQGGEYSMCLQLLRLDRGDRSFVGLPVFPLRNFTARDLYVRQGGPIKTAADLAGKRIGMYGWANSGSVWYRHFLTYLGVDITKLRWWIGPVDAPYRPTTPAVLPEGVHSAPEGRSLSDMLIAGELDAVYSPPRPEKYHPVNGPLARLFPDFRSIEQKYFRDTGAYPPQHLIILRRAAWEANKWIARSITEAFIRCNDSFTEAQRGFPYATPWTEAELESTDAVMGQDFHPYGFEKTRSQIEMFADQAHKSGLTKNRITPEQYFEEFLAA